MWVLNSVWGTGAGAGAFPEKRFLPRRPAMMFWTRASRPAVGVAALADKLGVSVILAVTVWTL